MNVNVLRIWFSVVSVILVLAGMFFGFFGLGTMPVAREKLLPWQNALYCSIMIGWGVTLFFAGRVAFRRKDAELMKALLYGLIAWLIVEASFSLFLGVYFNIGVDLAVLAVLAIPLVRGIRLIRRND